MPRPPLGIDRQPARRRRARHHPTAAAARHPPARRPARHPPGPHPALPRPATGLVVPCLGSTIPTSYSDGTDWHWVRQFAAAGLLTPADTAGSFEELIETAVERMLQRHAPRLEQFDRRNLFRPSNPPWFRERLTP